MAADAPTSSDPNDDAFGRWLKKTEQAHLLETDDEQESNKAFIDLFLEFASTEEGQREIAKHEEIVKEKYGLGEKDPVYPEPLQIQDGVDSEEVAYIRSIYVEEDDKRGCAITDEAGRIVDVSLYTAFLHEDAPPINGSLRRLANLRHVKKASIGFCIGRQETRKPLPTDTLLPLAEWKQLEELEICLDDMGAEAWVALAEKNSFNKLMIFRFGVEKTGANSVVKTLVHANNLIELVTNRNDLSDEGLSYLANCQNLQDLNLCDTQITGVGFRHLRCQDSLRYLNLDGCPISDEGLIQISRFTKLEELYLNSDDVSEVGVGQLSNIKGLQSLCLANASITEEGLKVLLQLEKLETLMIENTQVGDAIIPILEQLPNLTLLNIQKGTKISPAGLARLQRALPNCQIY